MERNILYYIKELPKIQKNYMYRKTEFKTEEEELLKANSGYAVKIMGRYK